MQKMRRGKGSRGGSQTLRIYLARLAKTSVVSSIVRSHIRRNFRAGGSITEKVDMHITVDDSHSRLGS